MKTLIALTFIGILTYAFAEEPSNNPECNYQAVANFDSTKYLQMTPLYSTYAMYGNLTVCRVFQSITKSGDEVNINIHGYYQESEQIHNYEMSCNTNEENFKTGQYWAECNVVKDSNYEDTSISEPFKLYMSVIDTDYDNYAILYLCMNDEFGFEDNFEVLQKNPGTSNDLIKNALKTKEMKLEEFFHRDATYCQNGNKEKPET